MEVIIELASRESVTFFVDDEGAGRAFFILGIRKCGSTLLNRVCKALAVHNSVNYVDVAGTFFKHNINAAQWVMDPAVCAMLRPGNAYGGFRNMPRCVQDT